MMLRKPPAIWTSAWEVYRTKAAIKTVVKNAMAVMEILFAQLNLNKSKITTCRGNSGNTIETFYDQAEM
jgi:hypothetical protein